MFSACPVLGSYNFYVFQIKMELITAAFFDAGDFSDTSLLEDAYKHLNDCLPGSLKTHIHDGKHANGTILLNRGLTIFSHGKSPLKT